MAEGSLSYQTTMPEYPDVSYQAWASQYGYHSTKPNSGFGSPSRLNNWLNAWFNGSPTYSTWRQNQLDEYNARMSAYNTWLQTGEGIRASAESGNYNPSYFQAGGQASASPLSYQDVEEGEGFKEMSTGLSGLLSFVTALQSLALKSQQIRGVDLANQKQSIENSYLGSILGQRVASMGYDVDWKNLRNTTELYSRYQSLPELWKGGQFSPFGNMSYDLRNTEHGLSYQKAVQDIGLRSAGVALKNAQTEMTRWNTKEKKFYVESIQSIYKDFLNTQLGLAKGELSFQNTQQALKKKAVNWGIGLSTANTIIGVARAVLGFINPVSRVPGSLGSFGSFTYQDPFPPSGVLGY